MFLRFIFFLIITFTLFVLYNFFYIYKLDFTSYEDYKNEKYENFQQVPDNIKNRAIQIEDKRFYHHFGVDFLALARALKEDIKSGKFKQGASTIDQQVIKLSEGNFGKRNIFIKLKEIFLATNLNFHYKKNNILLYWVNNIQFPYGVKGFKSACKIYFGKECNKLFDSEILFLFAIYQTGKNPFKDFKLIKDRSYVLSKYLEFSSPRTIYQLPPVNSKDIKLNLKRLTIFDLLPQNIKQKLKINKTYQNLSEKIIQSTAGYRKSINMQDCCILILDKSGNILTMNTCRKPGNNKNNSWINGCLIKRQTGSAIKPFVYLKAMIDFNRSGGTILEDKPVNFVLNGLKKYIPRNFDMKYHGKVPIAVALGSSLNVPAVTTLEKIGVQNFLNFINQLRLALGDNLNQVEKDKKDYTAEKLGLSAALGTYEMSVLEFANLWRIFLIDDIIGYNDLSFNHLLNKSSVIYFILSQNKNRLISFELENNLDVLGWAVKTGTSRHFIDGWTCGVNKEKQIVLCVWAGNYNQAGMTKPGSESAGFLWKLMAEGIK